MARPDHHEETIVDKLPLVRRLQFALDRVRPAFSKGGRYERFGVLYEIIDGFLFTPATVTSHAPHIRDGIDLKRLTRLRDRIVVTFDLVKDLGEGLAPLEFFRLILDRLLKQRHRIDEIPVRRESQRLLPRILGRRARTAACGGSRFSSSLSLCLGGSGDLSLRSHRQGDDPLS